MYKTKFFLTSKIKTIFLSESSSEVKIIKKYSRDVNTDNTPELTVNNTNA